MKKFDLVLKGLDFNTVKKLSILLGFDVSTQEEKEKKKGREPKKDSELIAEIEKTVNDKKPKKKR